MIFGIDYASHQQWLDFAQLKREGHDFAITKVTGENNYVNPYWRKNHDAARAAGLIVGTYDWVEPQGNLAPDDAAKDYLRVVGDRQPGDLLTVDFETPDWHTGPEGRDIQAWMRTYLYTLKELSGQPVIVYTAPYFLQETGATGWDWLGRDFLYWMAAPGAGMVPDDAPWQQPLGPPWRRVTLHQHQWHARSTAIGSGGDFDRNRFNGTRDELIALGTPRAAPVIEQKTDLGLTRADGFMEEIEVHFKNPTDPGKGIPYKITVWAYNPDEGTHYSDTWELGEYQPWVALDPKP